MSMTGTNSHNVFQPFKRKDKSPRGRCVRWVIENGKAEQCGKRCKGQACDEHQHMTRPVYDSLRRRGLV